MPDPDSARTAALRQLPAIDALVRDERLAGLPRPLVLQQARELLAELRTEIEAGSRDAAAVAALFQGGAATTQLLARCTARQQPQHRRVVNATGIVLHTGLGRAPLAQAAMAAIAASAGYALVELDPDTGERGQRERFVAGLLVELCGAEAALVVNNNAAATTLALGALCAGKDVVISRGELVEIGGGFRMPEVMARSGCRMVEVGTTNKTWLRDYEQAIGEATVALLKVHPSNFRIEGFASVPALRELVVLAHARSVWAIEDLGSGLLWGAPIAGLEHEPRVEDSLDAGADLVCFSGDKLLGGPQCGILLGKRELIARLRAHPLYRACRCDKLTLAGLEATLRIYRDGDPLTEIPTLRLLAATADELRHRSEQLAGQLRPLSARVVPSDSFAGAGANPARPLPSYAVALPGGAAANAALRAARPLPVFARVRDEQVLLDARTLLLEDLAAVAAVVRTALSS